MTGSDTPWVMSHLTHMIHVSWICNFMCDLIWHSKVHVSYVKQVLNFVLAIIVESHMQERNETEKNQVSYVRSLLTYISILGLLWHILGLFWHTLDFFWHVMVLFASAQRDRKESGILEELVSGSIQSSKHVCKTSRLFYILKRPQPRENGTRVSLTRM